jgi:Fe-S oxidoreductase
MAPQDRLAWAEGLSVPTVAENPEFEVLYWVGCAAAYDPRLQRVARSVVQLLHRAGVSFAVLGRQEKCTGEAARRMGDELLFQQLAAENTQALQKAGVDQRRRTVLTHCPHCANSLRQDYKQLGLDLHVMHHSEFLAELIQSGRLKVSDNSTEAATITYHDPCYLARIANTVEAPRELLSATRGAGSIVEMPRHGRQTACCGAGGGRMWFDDGPETRTGRSRVREALATGAPTLAVSCPFCLIMTSDGLAAENSTMAVRDVAEILVEQLGVQETPGDEQVKAES